jgi:hypothetical protein
MVSNGILLLLAAGGLSLPILAHDASSAAPIPSDPLEMVTGQTQAVDMPASRKAILELLGRARSNYTLRTAGQGYDLQATFTVNSGGQTRYDGAWQMEDTFDPKQGLRWTANAGRAYTITEIFYNGKSYSEGTPSYIPLRLQEARAALFGPIPSEEELERAAIRTSTANFQSAEVTCVLLSRSANAGTSSPGRRWDETEECIDPQSGLLMVHSQVPGRYYAYHYSNAPQFAGHTLPRKVTVTEAGKIVSEISIDSLKELPAGDPSLFVPTENMKAGGRAVAMAGAQKITRAVGIGSFPSEAATHSVCVFGLVTAAGQLVEAHSLQPSDPYSQAAIAATKQMTFSSPPVPGELGAPPQQHFVFVIEKFVPSR